MPKTIKISESNYRMLNNYAGTLRSRLGRPVSIDKVLAILLKKNKSNLMDFAGSWNMGEKESKDIEKSLGRIWERWNLE